jgi:hypothetical protein
MPHSFDRNNEHVISHRVNDAVVSKANAKSVPAPLHFAATGWARIRCQILSGTKHAVELSRRANGGLSAPTAETHASRHDEKSAIIGSTRLARRAGIQQASKAIARSRKAIPVK